MRILQLAHQIYPYSSAGVEVYVYALAKELLRRGHPTAVAASFAPAGHSAEVPLYPLPVTKKDLLRQPIPSEQTKAWKAFHEVVNEFKPDLVHVHHLLEMGLKTLADLQALNLPFVLSVHDYFYICPGINRMCGGNFFKCAVHCVRPHRGKGYLWRLYRACRGVRRTKRRTISLFNAMRCPILLTSRAAAEIYEQEGLAKGRATIQPLGIDISSMRPEESSRSGPPRFGFAGSAGRKEKGLDDLLAAFQKIDIPSELHLWGLEETDLKSKPADFKNPVYFHGSFDHALINHVLTTFDILVVPSIWEETYCLTAQEALAAQKVVIANAVGGLKERIFSGVNGFLVPPKDSDALAATMRHVAENLADLKGKLDYTKVRDIQTDGEWIEQFYARTVSQWNRP